MQTLSTVFVVGERCSGITYLRQQLQAALGPAIAVVEKCQLGSQHWPHFQGIQQAKQLGIVVITRNILDWLKHFGQTCNNVDHLARNGLTACLSTTPWWSHVAGKINHRVVQDCNFPYGNFYRDIFEMRRNKLRFWREVLRQSPHVPHVFIRYEDLVTQLSTTITTICATFQVPNKNNLTRETTPPAQSSQIFVHQDLSSFTPWQLTRIRQQTDWDVERTCGYGNIARLLSAGPPQPKAKPRHRLPPTTLAYVWLPTFWKNRQHYIKEEEIKRWALFADVVNLEMKWPSTLAQYDHVILEATVLRKYMNNATMLELLRSAKTLTLDCHDLHDQSFPGGRLALLRTTKALRVRRLIVKNLANPETQFLVTRLDADQTLVNQVSFGVPEQFIPPPSQELLNAKWAKRLTNPKRIGVFVYGNLNPKFYPLRYRIAKVLKKLQRQKKSRIRIVFHKDKGTSRHSASSISKKKLFDTLQGAWLSLCSPSKYHYTVLKYWETAGAGCSILGPAPRECPLRSSLSVTAEMSDKQIKHKIMSTLLRRKHQLVPIIRHNYQAVALKHTLLLKIIQTIDLITSSPMSFPTLVHHWITGPRQSF